MEKPKALFESTRIYLRDVLRELSKVVWPTRPRIVRLTGVVILMVSVVSAYLYLLDQPLSAVMGSVFNR